MSAMRTIAVLAIIALAVAAETCGGNCPSDDCNSCPCGTSRDVVDIDSFCSQYSGWSMECCRCIVSHESGGNAHAVNHNSNGSNDVGLFQINDINWPSCSGGQPPCNPSTSLECAKEVFHWGSNTWKLWSTCGGCGCCGRA